MPLKYTTAFEIARTARQNRESFGFLYRPGADRAAALAAVDANTEQEVIFAMTNSLICHEYRSPGWDGSIG